jgi:hypothetical protein
MKKVIITLVHLGNHPSPYLWTNIEQLIERFPDNEVALIYDTETFIEGRRIPGLTLHKYERVQLEQDILEKQLVPMSFRMGYWRFTLERFLSLQTFHQKNTDAGILHIESDVLLLPDFPFESISTCENIMWCPCDTERDVGSLLYSPTPAFSGWLKGEILKSIGSKEFITDMVILRRIAGRFPEKVIYFQNQIQQFKGLEPQAQGVFDGYILGLWLTGIDPRNYFGVTRVRDKKTLQKEGSGLRPWEATYEYSNEQGLRQKTTFGEARIWNLHIHSKNSKLLGADWENELVKYVKLTEKNSMSTEFNWEILKELITTNFQQGQLIRFLLGHRVFAPVHWVKRMLPRKPS